MEPHNAESPNLESLNAPLPTVLLHLGEESPLEAKVHVVQDDKRTKNQEVILLDRTPFYPGGGGQQADRGIIRGESAVFIVNSIVRRDDGIVEHRGHYESGSFENREQALASVDPEFRQQSNRYHSAGHLIDYLYRQLYSGIGKPVAVSHNPERAFLRYDGAFGEKLSRLLVPHLEERSQELLATPSTFVVKYYPKEEAVKLCQSPTMYVNDQGSCRVVSIVIRKEGGKIEGQSSTYCGGTHVSRFDEIGKEIGIELRCKGGKEMVVKYELL